MLPLLFTSGSDHTWAPSGIDYKDETLYVSTLKGSKLLSFHIDSGEQSEVISDLGRLRDVLVDKDALYVITNNTDGRGNPEDADDILFKMPLSNTE